MTAGLAGRLLASLFLVLGSLAFPLDDYSLPQTVLVPLPAPAPSLPDSQLPVPTPAITEPPLPIPTPAVTGPPLPPRHHRWLARRWGRPLPVATALNSQFLGWR